MRLTVLITTMVMFAAGLVFSQADTRPKLPNAYSTDNGYPVTTNRSWVKDTLALRALCDSNGYQGSCLILIASFVTDANSRVDPSGIWNYRVSQLRFMNLPWLKKITKNIDSLIYLSYIVIDGCTNLIYITGINKYVQTFAIYNAPISTFNFSFNYIKSINIYNCKNLKTFPYQLPNTGGIRIERTGLNDLTGFSIGDFVYNIKINMRYNKLTTLPVRLLQKLIANNDSIDINGNYICNAPPDVTTLLDQIAIGDNWRTSQICSQVSTDYRKYPTKIIQNKNEAKSVDLKGRTLKKELHRFYIKKDNIRL